MTVTVSFLCHVLTVDATFKLLGSTYTTLQLTVKESNKTVSILYEKPLKSSKSLNVFISLLADSPELPPRLATAVSWLTFVSAAVAVLASKNLPLASWITEFVREIASMPAFDFKRTDPLVENPH